MNPQLFFARLQTAAMSLSTRQLTTLGLSFLAVVSLIIGSTYWINTPTYAVLFSDMDSESASGVVARLKNEKIAYTIDEGGRTVRVPSARVDELRLDLAAQGMPTSGRIGFEIFDRTAFGVTDFLEHVNYRRALEGELARTIGTIAEVAGARVHIAMPQPSLFAGHDQPTKASVVLRLRNHKQLSASTVGAITGLVAASVESLKPESVVIIDNYGRPLAKAGNEVEDTSTGAPLERQQRIEHDLAASVVSLLEPIVGVGRARVNVSAKLSSGTQEETEERWDPTTVVRSHQSVRQGSSVVGLDALAGASGLPAAGARSNLPPSPSTIAAADATAAAMDLNATGLTVAPGAHVAETTNYEVSKLTRHSLKPRGDIARLSVAVVLDDEHPSGAAAGQKPAAGKTRPPAEIQKIHDLVAASVGLDADRGDQLTVENIAFEEIPIDDVLVPGKWKQYGPQALEGGRILGIVLIGLVVILAVIRPMIRSAFALAPAAAAAAAGVTATIGALPRTVQDLESEMDAQLAGETEAANARRLPVLTRRVAALTQREPENAARLLRTWLTEDDK